MELYYDNLSELTQVSQKEGITKGVKEDVERTFTGQVTSSCFLLNSFTYLVLESGRKYVMVIATKIYWTLMMSQHPIEGCSTWYLRTIK